MVLEVILWIVFEKFTPASWGHIRWTAGADYVVYLGFHFLWKGGWFKSLNKMIDINGVVFIVRSFFSKFKISNNKQLLF
jgi:hypothetical protein